MWGSPNFTLNPTNWASGATFKLVLWCSGSTSDTNSVKIYNVTDSADLAGSQANFNGSGWGVQSTSALTFVNNKTYQLKSYADGASSVTSIVRAFILIEWT